MSEAHRPRLVPDAPGVRAPRRAQRPRPAARAAPRAATVLAAALLLAPPALAQRFASGQEVMDAMADQPAPETTIASLTMTITAASGHALTREMQVWTTTGDDADGEGANQLIKFTAPADVRGSGFMSVGGADGASESYIYLPALDRVRRVAGGQEQDAFFGSDFSYEDITGLTGDVEGDFEYTLLEVRDGPTYVVEGVPTGSADTSYERVVYQVPEELLLPTRIEFYRDGALFKVMTISQTVEQDGFRLPTEIRMETVAAGSFTTLVQTGFQLDTEIPDDVFTERFLRR